MKRLRHSLQLFVLLAASPGAAVAAPPTAEAIETPPLTVLAVAAPEGAQCKRACYRVKATAYENCRTRPAADREARQQCFRRADEALATCLETCG